MRRTHAHRAVLLAVVAATEGGGLLAPAVATSAASCSDVDLVFARGTGEPQGPSVLQTPMLNALTKGLAGKTVSSYGVVYPAGFDQQTASGTADLVAHVTSVAKSCPATEFVLGGYSQGATVVDGALGVGLGYGTKPAGLPSAAGDRVAAVATFGNPLGVDRLAGAAPAYRTRVKEYCATGDPVCHNGNDTSAHLSYITNGDPAAAGTWAAAQVKAAGSASPGPSATSSSPAPSTAPSTSPSATASSAPPTATTTTTSPTSTTSASPAPSRPAAPSHRRPWWARLFGW